MVVSGNNSRGVRQEESALGLNDAWVKSATTPGEFGILEGHARRRYRPCFRPLPLPGAPPSSGFKKALPLPFDVLSWFSPIPSQRPSHAAIIILAQITLTNTRSSSLPYQTCFPSSSSLLLLLWQHEPPRASSLTPAGISTPLAVALM
jgi:hypothetical protein